MEKDKFIPLTDIQVMDSFWSPRQELISKEVIPHQWEALNDNIPDAPPSHAVENLRIAAGEVKGDYQGECWQDSDLAKWFEAASFSLIHSPDAELEGILDSLVDLFEKAQQEDGYLNTFYINTEPDKRFTNLRDNHELYCAGHLIEAAVAFYLATGKRKFLEIMCRYADLIDNIFGTEPGKKRGYCGHEEIELALVKLYQVTGNEKYLKLSKYFIDERGREPYYFDIEAKERQEKEPRFPQHKKRSHLQAHIPVREQKSAEGHAVRVTYLACAMADLVRETGDESLWNTCRTLWDNVTQRRMYITGGVGSMWYEEAFTIDYDLPNRRAYAETCAAIGMVLWAHRMLQVDPDSKYADLMERVLYNGMLSGMSLDGKKYFYVNPLEVWPDEANKRVDLQHIKTQRVPWYGCACCPPNITRLIASIGQYIYSQYQDKIYVHLFIGSKVKLSLNGETVILTQQNNYPWEENIIFSVTTPEQTEFTLALRIPEWCKNPSFKINGEVSHINAKIVKGYIEIKRKWNNNDRVELTLPMPVEQIQSNPNLRDNAGKVAIQRGPLVYCLEEIDNGSNLQDIALSSEAKLTAEFDPNLLGGITVIQGEGLRTDLTGWQNKLYQPTINKKVKIKIKAIPYSYWENRLSGEMILWVRQLLD